MSEIKGIVVGFAVIVAFLLGCWDGAKSAPVPQSVVPSVVYNAPVTTYYASVSSSPPFSTGGCEVIDTYDFGSTPGGDCGTSYYGGGYSEEYPAPLLPED